MAKLCPKPWASPLNDCLGGMGNFQLSQGCAYQPRARDQQLLPHSKGSARGQALRIWSCPCLQGGRHRGRLGGVMRMLHHLSSYLQEGLCSTFWNVFPSQVAESRLWPVCRGALAEAHPSVQGLFQGCGDMGSSWSAAGVLCAIGCGNAFSGACQGGHLLNA